MRVFRLAPFFVLAVLLCVVSSAAAQSPALLRTQLPLITVSPGASFQVVVEVVGGAAVDGAEVHLQFNPAHMQVTSLAAGTALPLTIVSPTFSNTAGTIAYAAGAVTNFPGGTFTLLTINFTATNLPTAGSPINFVRLGIPRQSEVTFGGRAILGGLQGSTVVIGGLALPLTLSPALPNGVVGQGYNQTPFVSGGTAPYSFSVIRGSLPAGLSINGAGAITGTPTQPGMSIFSLRVTDNAGATTWQEVILTITSANAQGLVFTPTSLPTANLNTPYQAVLGAMGGTPPYSFSLISGTLPAGLAFNNVTATITGTPTALGSTALTFQVTDSAGNIGVATLILTVAPTDALAGH
jgi:hypothetical protein